MAIKQETAGFKMAAEVRSFEGKTREGENFGSEAYRNTLTDELYVPEDGWKGAPPREWAGDLACVRHTGGRFSDEYWDVLAAELAQTENPPLWVRLKMSKPFEGAVEYRPGHFCKIYQEP